MLQMATNEEQISVPYTQMIAEGGERDTTMFHATTTITNTSNNQTHIKKTELHKNSTAIGPYLSDICVCIAFALLFTLVPRFALQPYRRGFFCGDESIRYPYKGSTVTSLQLFLICFTMLFITIIATEVFRTVKFFGSDPFTSKRLIVNFLGYSGYGIFGLLLNLAFTQTTKWAVGRLRPHFLDVCKPNITLTPCQDPYVYITEYVCQGSEEFVKEARLSFFSGHSAFSMGIAIFCVIYIQSRFPPRIYGLTIVPVLQTFLIGIALLIGLSRLSDHMHHWSDVLVGFIVGSAVGYYSAVILGNVFEPTDGSLTSADDMETRNTSIAQTNLVNPLRLTAHGQTNDSLRSNPSETQSPAQNSTMVITAKSPTNNS